MSATSDEHLDRVAALAEPVRRRLYDFVARTGEPVDRDTAAGGVGIGRPLAAFHLDRLADAGLLDVVFKRRSGRSGPGAGRPAKFYVRPRDRDVNVTLPARSYDLAAEILAEAVDRADSAGDARQAVLDAAHDRGVALAAGAAASPDPDGLLELLETEGYEPYADADGTVRLRNCPFHVLTETHRDLTCAMNLSFLGAAAETASGGAYRATAQPREGACCVAFVEDRG